MASQKHHISRSFYSMAKRGLRFLLHSIAAEVFHHALAATRLSGHAHCPSVQDQAMAEIVGFIRRQHSPQIFFNFQRIGAICQPQPPADSDTVGIGNDCRFMENIAHYQIGCFAADSGQLSQFFQRVGNDTVINVPQHAAHGINITGFRFI